MRDNLDFKVVINNHSKFESRYDWSINEVKDYGNKISPTPTPSRSDYVPYDWHLRFLTKNLTYSSTFKVNKRVDGVLDENTGTLESTDNERESIFGDMIPDNRGGSANYSIFGTNRTLDSFDLVIYGVDEGQEACECWGSPSYTTNVDWRDETTDDCFQVIVSVSYEKFAELKSSIVNKSLSSLHVCLRGVKGFYSPLTPNADVSDIKILPTQIPVEIPDDFELEVPKVGPVDEIELTPRFIQELCYRDETKYSTGEDVQQQTLYEVRSLKNVFGKITTPIWILVGLMGVLVLLLL